MAIEFPDGRRMHIARICGVDRNGEPVTDIWVDVLRIDKMKVRTQDSVRIFSLTYDHQDVTLKLKWNDAEGEDGYDEEDDGVSSRTVKIVKVCSPEEENPEEPEQWVPIPAIKKVHLRQGPAAVNRHFFDSVLKDKNREEVEIRRFCHYDTNFDEDATTAFEDGDKVYVMPVDEYEFIEDSKDENDYLEHEVVKKVIRKATPHWVESPGGNDTKSTFLFKNQFLLDASDEAEDAEEAGEDAINPPWRLDPFQNIINCLFTPAKSVLVGLVREGGGVDSNDGLEWGNQLEDAQSAASGLGHTIILSPAGEFYGFANGYIAFGKPRDGDPCFIILRQDGTIERGVLNDRTELTWDTIGQVPLNQGDDTGDFVTSLSFAGEAFFISYTLWQKDKSLMGVSFSGLGFEMGINPFPNVSDVARGSGGILVNISANPVAGTVAYDKENGVYVTTGTFDYTILEDEIYTQDGSDPPDNLWSFYQTDENFMWATSRDGRHWTAGYDTSMSWGQGTGAGSPHGPDSINWGMSNVAFGNGVFVSCGGKKYSQPNPNLDGVFTPVPFDGISAAAALVSSNGQSWDVAELPGQTVDINDTIDVSSTLSSAVIFIKKRVDKDHEGYFIMASDGGYGNTRELFYSLDGYDWSPVYTIDPQYAVVMSEFNKNKGKIQYQ